MRIRGSMEIQENKNPSPFGPVAAHFSSAEAPDCTGRLRFPFRGLHAFCSGPDAWAGLFDVWGQAYQITLRALRHP